MTRLPVLSRRTIPGRPEQVAEARAFVRVVLGEDHPAAETVVLLTSELVTNSVLHSASGRDGGTVTVTVAEFPEPAKDAAGLVRVEVTDDGAPGQPALRPAGAGDGESGHGLHLVDTLATRWGCRRDGGHGPTTTWFELTWGTREVPAGYARLGWPAEERDGRTQLVTGTVIDALEVPRTAGILAASWWRYTEGHPDVVRGLPALPDPRHALAVIAAGDRHYFVVRAGECPWRVEDPVTTAVTAASRTTVIRWHSQGSRIPAPADPPGHGSRTEAQPMWACLPDRSVRLPGPAVLLHLLATAAAMTRLGPHMLALHDGVLAIPIFGDPSPSPPGGTAAELAGTAPPFGFASCTAP